jgi:hypothetical protein
VPDPKSGVDDHGDWTPAFPGQRPPMRGEPGNSSAEKHGAYSPRRIRPLAVEWLKRLEESMRAAGVHASLDDVARERLASALARCDLLEQDLDERGYLDGTGELTTAAIYLHKLDRQVMQQLRELGLSLRSRSDIGLNVAGAQELMSRAEAYALVSAIVMAASPFLPVERRPEYMAAIEAIAGPLDTDERAAG